MRGRGYAPAMSPRFLQTCETFEPAEKACWEILFREQVDSEMSGETLADAMNQTLTQLWALLRVKSLEATLCEPPPLALTSPAFEACPLQIFLAYFTSGQRALALVAKEIGETPLAGKADAERSRFELLEAYERLMHAQLDAVCASCAKQGVCRLRGAHGPNGATRLVAKEKVGTRRRRTQ